MRGGQVFMESLVQNGVDCIFGNPGTTENPVLDRLIDYPGLPYYVALHEGVAVGAASFYAQATGRPAVANLHVAPGLGNAIGMMYGALKACSPLLVTAGAQDTRMRHHNPLLGHDLPAMARPVTKFSAEPATADEMGPLLRQAFQIACEPPCGPVFVALPVDVMEGETAVGPSRATPIELPVAPAQAIAEAAAIITAASNPVLVVGDDPARAGALDALVALAELAGAAVYHQGLRAHTCFPNRHPNYRGRTPFEAAAVRRLLASHDVAVLIGGTFFEDIWYDPGPHVPDNTRVIQLENTPDRIGVTVPVDVAVIGELGDALTRLGSALREAGVDYTQAASQRNAALAEDHARRMNAARAALTKVWDLTPMHPARAIAELARSLPEGTIVVDESITASLEVGQQLEERQTGDYFGGRGGGIGQGVAGAIGVQVAHPDRPVVAISGDGSAMYSIQALWSAAHHELPIVFIILANREYRVLKHNLDIYRDRFDVGSNKPYPHMDLTDPALDFAGLAQGMGVAGQRINHPDDIGSAVQRAFESRRPALIEIEISGKH